MGLFAKIFGGNKSNDKKDSYSIFKTLNGYSPAFLTWRGSLYEVDRMRAAVHAIANACSKLKIEFTGSKSSPLLTSLRHKPNNLQTWSQFLYRLITILEVQNNAFIVPVFDEYGRVTGLYPVLPDRCELVEYNKTIYLRYKFSNGAIAVVEFELCALLTKFQYKHDFFGESNSALDSTMSLIDINNQGTAEAIKSAATYRFMAKMNIPMKETDINKKKKEFNDSNFKGEGGGLLLFPEEFADAKQIISRPFTISSAEMEVIDTNVCSYFGVNKDILQNSAYGDKWSAFYEGAIEPIAIQLSETLTNLLFSSVEQSNGNKVILTANRLQYMSNQEKLNVSSQMLDRGIMNRDEVREIWNLPPLPNGEGKEYIIRGEYINAKEKVNVPKNDPNKKEEENNA